MDIKFGSPTTLSFTPAELRRIVAGSYEPRHAQETPIDMVSDYDAGYMHDLGERLTRLLEFREQGRNISPVGIGPTVRRQALVALLSFSMRYSARLETSGEDQGELSTVQHDRAVLARIAGEIGAKRMLDYIDVVPDTLTIDEPVDETRRTIPGSEVTGLLERIDALI